MFSKKSDASPSQQGDRPVASRGNNQGSTFSIIGTDVTIKGDIEASADLHIDGRIDGDITCASLVQGETSVINGAVVAQSARLAGSVSGSIDARELVILKTARIEGDVHYDALTIEQGAEVEGRFAHRAQQAGEAPARSKETTGSEEPKLTLAS